MAGGGGAGGYSGNGGDGGGGDGLTASGTGAAAGGDGAGGAGGRRIFWRIHWWWCKAMVKDLVVWWSISRYSFWKWSNW